ncbi:protein of unknown function [Xenorhabdus bovienii]|uniref:Uncharacterized protein n=1 Tax=Xenorhabdus bovienii TaxID=40576 RepID=A0A0B6XFH1_XENBV|nr:protein of unknown function [Xenorhabdus bovienii]
MYIEIQGHRKICHCEFRHHRVPVSRFCCRIDSQLSFLIVIFEKKEFWTVDEQIFYINQVIEKFTTFFVLFLLIQLDYGMTLTFRTI